MRPRPPQQRPRQQPIQHRRDRHAQQLQPLIPIQAEQRQHRLAIRNGAATIWQRLRRRARQAERREVVDAAQEGGHVDGEDAGHDEGDGEDDGGEVEGEAGVGKEGVELG
ncbi:hypothetical protein V502_03623 [Pseudogymnoascus sp. VKM F-4520 (FW-2644)]|nr:hypothetical protein V502_03623 [Pseudogymnoascus sp. VKM F-4520 (FW-2644)]